jgi:hypothetical protein
MGQFRLRASYIDRGCQDMRERKRERKRERERERERARAREVLLTIKK